MTEIAAGCCFDHLHAGLSLCEAGRCLLFHLFELCMVVAQLYLQRIGVGSLDQGKSVDSALNQHEVFFCALD
jgi:hypothetical protein